MAVPRDAGRRERLEAPGLTFAAGSVPALSASKRPPRRD